MNELQWVKKTTKLLLFHLPLPHTTGIVCYLQYLPLASNPPDVPPVFPLVTTVASRESMVMLPGPTSIKNSTLPGVMLNVGWGTKPWSEFWAADTWKILQLLSKLNEYNEATQSDSKFNYTVRHICKIVKSEYQFVTSVCPSVWNNSDAFTWNFIFEYFSNMLRKFKFH